MKLLRAASLLALLVNSVSAHLSPRDHDAYDYFALHLHPSSSPAHVAQLLGARHEGQIGELADHHTFSLPRGQAVALDQKLDHLHRRRRGRRKRRALDGDSMSGNPIGPPASVLDGIL